MSDIIENVIHSITSYPFLLRATGKFLSNRSPRTFLFLLNFGGYFNGITGNWIKKFKSENKCIGLPSWLFNIITDLNLLLFSFT